MAEKKLVRLPEQGQLAGVCAGLAEYFDIDVSFVRVGFVLAALFTSGVFVVGYIALAVILPVATNDLPKAASNPIDISPDIKANIDNLKREFDGTERGGRAKNYLGLGLVLLGLWLLIGQWYPDLWSIFSWKYLMPLALIAAGMYIVTRRNK